MWYRQRLAGESRRCPARQWQFRWRGHQSVKASEIPVGGGKIFPTEQIVVTQPTAGTYKAFSAICTHQGCFVTAVTNGKIECPCHMSQFNLDGTVATGPAVQPLPAKRITVSGDDLTIA